MKNLILVLSLVMGLTACSDSSKKSGNRDGGVDEKLTNVTDYSVCERASTQTDPEGTWMMSQEQGALRFDMFMTIDFNGVTLTNVCQVAGRELTATAHSNSGYTATTFSVYNESSDQQQIDEPNFKLNCSASLNKGSMNYAIKGRCLVLSKAGEGSVTLIPAN